MAQLTNEQIAAVAELVNGGAKLGDVQKFLNEQFGISMTYMEVRFLVDDLDLTVKDPKVEEKKTEEAPATSGDTSAQPEQSAENASVQGGVTVEISPVQIPGTIVSGKVTFTDGVTSMWSLDANGRLQLEGAAPDYRPSQADIEDFQQKLQTILSGQY